MKDQIMHFARNRLPIWRVFGYADSLMERQAVRKSLNRFEKLISDAIALLVEQGEIKIPPKKRRLRSQPSKPKKNGNTDQVTFIHPTKGEAIENRKYQRESSSAY